MISPLAADLFLHYVFDAWMTRTYPTLPLFRYADDGLVHCATRESAEHMLGLLRQSFAECGLELHPALFWHFAQERMAVLSHGELFAALAGNRDSGGGDAVAS